LEFRVGGFRNFPKGEFHHEEHEEHEGGRNGIDDEDDDEDKDDWEPAGSFRTGHQMPRLYGRRDAYHYVGGASAFAKAMADRSARGIMGETEEIWRRRGRASGNFSITATNAVDPNAQQRYYLLQLQ
jgi:hypothetical protein